MKLKANRTHVSDLNWTLLGHIHDTEANSFRLSRGVASKRCECSEDEIGELHVCLRFCGWKGGWVGNGDCESRTTGVLYVPEFI